MILDPLMMGRHLAEIVDGGILPSTLPSLGALSLQRTSISAEPKGQVTKQLRPPLSAS